MELIRKCKRCTQLILNKNNHGCSDCSEEWDDDEYSVRLCLNCCLEYKLLESNLYCDFLDNKIGRSSYEHLVEELHQPERSKREDINEDHKCTWNSTCRDMNKGC